MLYLNMPFVDKAEDRHAIVDTSDNALAWGMVAVHSTLFMGQPNEASQQAYAIVLSAQAIFDGNTRSHLLDWGSSHQPRKTQSIVACVISSASRAIDVGHMCTCDDIRHTSWIRAQI